MRSRVHQVVSSPIRNALTAPQRRAMRTGASRVGDVIARALRRSVRLPPSPVSIELENGPVFGNCMAELVFADRHVPARASNTPTPTTDGNPVFALVTDVEL